MKSNIQLSSCTRKEDERLQPRRPDRKLLAAPRSESEESRQQSRKCANEEAGDKDARYARSQRQSLPIMTAHEKSKRVTEYEPETAKKSHFDCHTMP
jgi:hypothetical protein